MRTPPRSALSHQSVEDREQLPHARHQSNLLGLAGRHEPFVELLDRGVEPRGDQGPHLERLSNPRPAAPHRATASQSAGVAVERSDADEGRELPRGKGAELGQLGKERPAKHGTHPGDAPQESLVLFEGGTVLDETIEVTIRAGKLLLEPPYVGLDAPADGFGGARPEAVFLGGHHPDDLPSSGEDLLELPGFRIGDGSGGGTDGLREVSEDESVQSVGLGQMTGSFGEVPRLARVDHEEGHSGGGQSRGEGALEATAGLQDHQKSLGDLRELAEKLIDPRLVVGNDGVFSGGEDGDVQGSLGDIYPYVGSSSSTGTQAGSPFLPVPNLAGAGSGSSSPAQATVRAPPEVIEGRGDPGFLAVSERSSGPRSIRSTAPISTDSRQKPKHKEHTNEGTWR